MASYRASVSWKLEASGQEFLKGQYSRGHAVRFEDGPEVRGTASHHVVGKRWAEAGAVDPEQMLVSAISTCHMLSFLHVARDAGFAVTSYGDDAEGVMEKNSEGKYAVTRVTLRPTIVYAGNEPSAEQSEHLHHRAHEECFIANSVRTEIRVEKKPTAEAQRR
jgi:organic hydroperoxide reductase OsmC/OhrA